MERVPLWTGDVLAKSTVVFHDQFYQPVASASP